MNHDFLILNEYSYIILMLKFDLKLIPFMGNSQPAGWQAKNKFQFPQSCLGIWCLVLGNWYFVIGA
jgi:hypothetical protein